MNSILFSGTVLLIVSVILFTMVLGGILYQHMVELPRWRSKEEQPPDFSKFFKLLMPTSFFSLLLAMLLLWNKTAIVHLWLLAGLVGMILTAILTNRYFVPIHTKLFHKETAEIDRGTLTDSWLTTNRYRISLMIITVICLVVALLT